MSLRDMWVVKITRMLRESVNSWGTIPIPLIPKPTLMYELAKPGEVQISIYNLKGQLIRKLVDRAVNAGTHSAVWDGKDTSGNPVSSGVYFYRMKTDKSSQSKKMLLIK